MLPLKNQDYRQNQSEIDPKKEIKSYSSCKCENLQLTKTDILLPTVYLGQLKPDEKFKYTAHAKGPSCSISACMQRDFAAIGVSEKMGRIWSAEGQDEQAEPQKYIEPNSF